MKNVEVHDADCWWWVQAKTGDVGWVGVGFVVAAHVKVVSRAVM